MEKINSVALREACSHKYFHGTELAWVQELLGRLVKGGYD